MPQCTDCESTGSLARPWRLSLLLVWLIMPCSLVERPHITCRPAHRPARRCAAGRVHSQTILCESIAPPVGCNGAKQCLTYTGEGLVYFGGVTKSVITSATCAELPPAVTAQSTCLVSGAGKGSPGIPCRTFTTERYNFSCISNKVTLNYTCWMIYCTGCAKK